MVEQGRLLAIFYYIFGALSIACSSVFIIYVVIGVLLAIGAGASGPGPSGSPVGGTVFVSPDPGPIIGWLFSAFGLAAIAIGWGIGIAEILTGRFLTIQRHHTYCLVVAVLTCLSFPFGTILGVFTIVWLAKPEVQAEFQANRESLRTLM